MREAIGGTWIFQIVIFFILLFTGYMCLSINHSKAFNVKNTIVKAIERSDGVDLTQESNDPAISKIVNYLKETSYRTTGKCDSGYTGYNREGRKTNNNASFCIAEVPVRAGHSNELPNMRYYRVVVFYQLDLPIFRSVFEFRVSGDTKVISETIKG